MADAIKSVVLQVETILKGNAIDQAVKGLENADGAAAELRKTLEAVQSELNKISAQKPLENTNRAAQQSAGTFQRLRQRVTETAGSFNGLSSVKDLVGRGFEALTGVISRNIIAFTGAATAGLGFISLPFVAFFKKTKEGADLLAETLGGFKAITNSVFSGFAKIGEGLINLDFGKITEGVKGFFGSFSTGVFNAGRDLERFKSDIEEFSAVANVQRAELDARISENQEILSKQAKTLKDIENQERAISNVQRDRQQKYILDRIEREDKLEAAIKELSVRKGISLEEARRTDPLSLPDEFRDKILQARQELSEVERDNNAFNKRFNDTIDSVSRRRAQIIQEQIKEAEEARKRLQKIQEEFLKFNRQVLNDAGQLQNADPFGVGDLQSLDDRIAAQDRILQGILELNEELQKLAQVVGVADLLKLTPEEISSLEKQYKLAGGTIAKAVRRGVKQEAQLQSLIVDIFQVRPTVTVAPLDGVTEQIKLTPDEIERLSERIKKTLGVKPVDIPVNVNPIVRSDGEKESGLKRFFDLTDEERKLIGESFRQVEDEITKAANTFYESEIAKTDFLIQEQQRRIDETNRLAALGNAEQLQLEQERLNNLLEERRKFEQAQAAINAAAAISATAVSAATFAASITKESFTKTPAVAIAQSIALVATIAAGIAQISALAGGFEKGTEYLTPGQKSNKGKTDTIPAWLAPGERVVPAMINEQLKGIKNADLPKLVAAGKMALEGYGQLNTSITSNSYGFTSEAVGLLKRQNELLAEIPKAVSDQIVDINFDHYGYVIQQRRVSRHAQKVKALTR